ncbi:hypothetical protein ACC810_38350, partial [Rhizobium ruizarguesonis]
AEGRLLVPDFIRGFTGISADVPFVGRADHFQLWQPQAFVAAQVQARNGKPKARKTCPWRRSCWSRSKGSG